MRRHHSGDKRSASMEPSSAEDGNPAVTSIPTVWLVRLQWSRPQLRTETTLAVRDSRGWKMLQWSRPQLRTETWATAPGPVTTALLQWSRPLLRTETGYSDSSGRQYRKLQWSRPQLRTETPNNLARGFDPLDASMEPSSAEDGNYWPAVDFRRRKGASMEPSSAEDGNHQQNYEGTGGRFASMEPSSAEDGNSVSWLSCNSDTNCFNGAVLS